MRTVGLYFIICLFSGCLSAFSSENDTIYIGYRDINKTRQIADKIHVLKDSLGQLDIYDVLSSSAFNPHVGQSVDFKASESVYWIKFIIKNTDNLKEVKRYIALTSIDIYEVKLFTVNQKQEIVETFTTGNQSHFDTRAIDTHDFTFPISLKPNEAMVVYAYLDHKYHALSTNLIVLDDMALANRISVTAFSSGLAIGILVLLLLISIMLYIFFRSAINFNYVLYLLGATIFFLSFNEGNRYVWDSWPYFQDASQYVGPTILLIGFIGVFRLFFKVRDYSPVLDKVFNFLRFSGLFLVIGFLFWRSIGGFYYTLYQVLGILLTLSFLMCMVVGFYVYMKDKRQDYAWFLASMIFLVFTSSFILLVEQTTLLARKDFAFLFNILPHITLYYEAIILCFFLIKRVYQEKLAHERHVLEERQSIIEGLHDEVISSLGGISTSFSNLKLEFEQIPYKDKMENIRNRVSSTLGELREITEGLGNNSRFLDDVIADIKRYAFDLYDGKKTKLEFDVHGNRVKVHLPIQLRRNLKGFFKEAIYNSVKYSEADNFRIEMRIDKENLSFSIFDDGVGFDYDLGLIKPKGSGNGLRNLERKSKRMKASHYKFETCPGSGVQIRLNIDLKQFNVTDYI